MSRSIDDLIPAFQEPVRALLAKCCARNVIMKPYCTLRTPQEQAKLWRQSRSWFEIEKQIIAFEENDAFFLAQCLRDVGPQHGPKVTNALPGYGWHQHGEAIDCFWLLDGKANWSLTAEEEITGVNGYSIYAAEARNLGLKPGLDWGDGPHVQLRHLGSAAQAMSLAELDKIMEQRFG